MDVDYILRSLELVINNIGLDHFINNEINFQILLNTFKTFFGSFVRKKNPIALIKSVGLNFPSTFLYCKVNNSTCLML